MSRKFHKELLRRMNDSVEREETYPDYSDISIMFGFFGEEVIYSLPNKTSSGKIKTYTMVNKKELLANGVSEDYLSKLEYNYFLMERNKQIKTKLHSKIKKIKVKFNLKSNIKHKEYSDGFTIIEDLRKPKKVITMKTIMHYSNDYFRNVYFDSKYIMKLRSRIASGKKNSVYREDRKSNIYCAKKYLTKKDLSRIKRTELCLYYIKKNKE